MVAGLLDCGHYSHSVRCPDINTFTPQYETIKKKKCVYMYFWIWQQCWMITVQNVSVIWPGQSLLLSGINDA